MVSSTDFVRASERATAIATLNRQRHLMPSCGGLTPIAERTAGPARMIVESLTSTPGIREHYRHEGEVPAGSEIVRLSGKTRSDRCPFGTALMDPKPTSPARPRFRPRTATVRRFTTDGLSQASYRATRDGSAIDYVLKRPAVLVGSAWPGGEQGKCHANGRALS
jgi:hypothetical protein